MMPAKTCTQRIIRFSHSLRVGLMGILLLGSLVFGLRSGSLVLGFWHRNTLSFPDQRPKAQDQLAAAVSGITVWTDQKRNVIVLWLIANLEDNDHLRIEGLNIDR